MISEFSLVLFSTASELEVMLSSETNDDAVLDPKGVLSLQHVL